MRCTICSKEINPNSCDTIHHCVRYPYSGKGRNYKESRGASWLMCKECAETIEDWLNGYKYRRY